MKSSMQSVICSPYFSRMAFLFYAFVIPFLTITTLSTSYNGGNETDLQALLKFKSMTHDPYRALSSWNTSLHFCDWTGVICGKRHRRVTYVRLESKGLEGSVSPYIGNLTFLQGLSFVNNSFQGIIPHELGRLSRLRILYLSLNKFKGSIPTNLSGCSNLEKIQIDNNQLVGSIPKEISFLSKLTVLAVHTNNLTGGIPHFFGNITSMEVFSATGNPLGGTIPDTLGHLKSLRELYAGECNLYGTIPLSFYNMSLLNKLSFSANQLNGSLPLAIGTMLPHLTLLQLEGNQLTGLLPPSISKCSKLQELELTGNHFSGRLTIDFSNLRDIVRICLGGNFFGSEEADEMKFIDSLTNCSRLQTLNLASVGFQGMLPSSIGNISNQLEFLYIQGNQLHGSLPTSIGNIVGLITLVLGGNRFTGNIPSTIGMLHNLQGVYLNENQFSGQIPAALGKLTNLTRLDLHSNRLEGHIPTSLGNCRRLSELYLDDNRLSGKIPKQLVQLSSLSVSLNLSHNSLSGSLPTEVGDLTMLSHLDLSYNNLSGNIPSSLGDCTSLSSLFLNWNLFQGVIPPSFSSLKGMMQLDLSHNNLSGRIPPFLERYFEAIDLSYNDLDGEVPVLGVFNDTNAFSVLGNSKLCGGLPELGLPKCKKHKKRFPLFVIVILISSLLFAILCFVYTWRKKNSKGQRSQSLEDDLFIKVSYNQLLKATDGFSAANLIGQGGFSSVYKGTLDVNADEFVAVKVLHLQTRGAQRSFTRECEAWRNIRHRNLLKIITSCSSLDFQGNDFKALVYEFMPNGSLHDWLHSSASKSRLDLLQRISILIDVASALHYLHSQCLPSVVHGDLKPSNILLDDDMVAHVGDYGLARFIGTNSNQNSSTGVKGTIGYAPPEYGLGNETTSSGDVYSFGILLLEVMTGKKPTDDIFNEGFNLHKFAYEALPDHVTDVIDGDAFVIQSKKEADATKVEECLVSTVKIGVSCSADSPPQRMNIENVVNELQHILVELQNI